MLEIKNLRKNFESGTEALKGVDLKIYREAENKDIDMAEVEYVLKVNAVDCNLNKYNNQFILNILKRIVNNKLLNMDGINE